MTPHPQSSASLLALNDNLRKEELARRQVYKKMEEKLKRDLEFVRTISKPEAYANALFADGRDLS